MPINQLILTAVFGSTFFGAVAVATEEVGKPNILLVLVDDMGYSDLGCYGSEIETPNLDRLAADGVRMARFYNGAQCCPSRASLLSGLYPHQAGMGDMNPNGPANPHWTRFGSESYLGLKQTGIALLPEVLRAAGYQTFMSGKWHVGDPPKMWPSVRGFGRTFSLIDGASQHFSGRHAWKKRGPIATFIRDGRRLRQLPENFYTTDTFTDEAIHFIEKADPDRPWFTYLAYTAPHWPLQAHERDIQKYRGRYSAGPTAVRKKRFARMQELGLVPDTAVLPPPEPNVTEEAAHARDAKWERWMETYAAMIDCVDQNIGRLISTLKRRDELENTLILFLSDNGADTVHGPLWGMVSNAPFRAHKVWVYDGGIATPLIAHWPAGIPAEQAGRIIDGYGHIIDLQPTCLAAARVEQPETWQGEVALPLEGIDLLPALRGKAPLPEDRPLFWERMGNEAVRLGGWKLVRDYNGGTESGNVNPRGPRTGQWQLFDVSADPGETRDLIGLHPERATELYSLYRAWANRVDVIPREIINAAANDR